MAQYLEIILPVRGAQTFTTVLNQVSYTFTLIWRNVGMGGWFLDIGDANNNPLICGLPLLPGADMLAQHRADYDLGGGLWVQMDNEPDANPGYLDIGPGGNAHLYFLPDS